MGGLRVSVRAWLLWAVLSYVSGSEGVSTGYRRSQAGQERSPLRRLCEKVLQSGGTCDGDSHYSFYTAPDNTLTTLPDTTSSGGNTGATSTGITALSKVHTDITTETWTTNPMFTPTGVSTLSLKPEEEKMVNLDYLACSKFLTNNNFGVSSSVSRQINTARCGTNEVIVGFEAYDQVNFQSPNTNWDNALYLYSVCSQLVNYQVKSGECEIVQVSNVPWTGIKDVGDMKTDLWDYWFSCSPDYLAVQVNRETNGDLRQVVNIECCRVSPN
ncbi:hypothetical protein Hamer_G015128 [Homarus americanus]|uniref:Uncharacterized protein n=1 Tax=Homarus americanus TaxID=6706 RepID=A0A8J5THQ4_HOMAM|nr:hypothetical protein Hamer_G015128 [Homarus americanus]